MAIKKTNQTGITYDPTLKVVYGSNSSETINLATLKDAATNATVVTGGGWRVAGGNGDDTVIGSDFNDLLYGDSDGNSDGKDNGQDTLKGGKGNDEIHGGNGKDYLEGGDDNDTLYGDNGVDVLYGGAGADDLTGGNAGDTFLYKSVSESAATVGGAWNRVNVAASQASATATGDWIKDFESGSDKIDLGALNSNLTGSGPTKLTFSAGGVATAHGVWTDGQFLYADTTGDTTADLVIKVSGVKANDFVGVNHGPSLAAPAAIAYADTSAYDDFAAAGSTLSASDSDGDTITYGVTGGTGAGTNLVSASNAYGTLTLNTVTGAYSFEPNDAAINALNPGQNPSVSFTLTATDPYGASASQTLTINLTGANDAPVFSGTYDGTVVEAGVTAGENGQAVGTPTAMGNANYSDVDTGSVQDTWTAATDVTTTYGKFSVNAAGEWTYTLDDTNATVNALNTSSTPLTDTFTLTATNGGATKMVTITINGSNDAPTTFSESVTVDENGIAMKDVVANDIDPDDNNATLTIGRANINGQDPATRVTGPDSAQSNGLSIASDDRTLVFDLSKYNDGQGHIGFDHLAQGATATISIDYNVEDPHGANSHLTNPAYSTLTVNITGSNDGPTANADTASGGENETLTINVLANDTDPDDGATLSVTGASVAAGSGSVSVVDNKVVFDPGTDFDHLPAGETATVTITYSIEDEFHATSTSTVTVTLIGTDDAPVFSGSYSGTAVEAGRADGEGAAVTPGSGDTGNADYSDVDDGSDQDVWAAASGSSAHGSFTVDEHGVWVYTPNNDDTLVNGLQEGQTLKDSFSIYTSDGTEKVVQITINGANDAPQTNDDTGAVGENGSVSVNVVANDTDVDNLSADLRIGRANTLNGGTVNTPGASSNGLTLEADGRTLTFNPDNYTDPLTQVKGFDYLAEGQQVVVRIDYNVYDPQGASSNSVGSPPVGASYGSLYITVTGTSDGPVASDSSATVAEDGSVTAAASATDVDSSTLTYTLGTGPAHGSLDFHDDGTYTYTPNANYNGTDSFTFTASDGSATSDAATVSLTVTEVNDAPVATDDTLSAVAEDSGARSISIASLLGNDSKGPANEAGQTLTLTSVQNAVGGTAVINGANVIFTPTANFNGAASFDYTVSDNGTTAGLADPKSDDGHVSFTVTPVNDPATITGDKTGSVTEDAATTTATGTLSVSDIDGPGEQSFQAQTNTPGTYGTFTLGTNGAWTYSLHNEYPATNALNGSDHPTETFTVKSADGTQSSVVITVNGHNDAPTLEAVFTGNGDKNDFDDLKSDTTSGNINGGNQTNDTLIGSSDGQNIDGKGGNDDIYGRGGDDTLTGNTGNDNVYGQAGNDTISGNEGTDSLYGGSGNDALTGNNENDTLYGGSGTDSLNGGNGTDTLVGGYGADTLTGGGDADIFKFINALDRGDHILDFSRSEGDKIDVAGIDADTTDGQNDIDSFKWGGTNATAHGIWYSTTNGVTTVYADTDGNTATAEFHFYLDNGLALQPGDFTPASNVPIA